MKGYVLVNVRAGTIRAVVQKLRQIDGVQSEEACCGRPDVFAVVEGASLAPLVMDQIQSIEGIESTDTHIVIEQGSPAATANGNVASAPPVARGRQKANWSESPVGSYGTAHVRLDYGTITSSFRALSPPPRPGARAHEEARQQLLGQVWSGRRGKAK